MVKPVVFLSHSSRDATYLNILKEHLRNNTSETLKLFLSSDGQSIPFGRNWVSEIESALNSSTLMFSFISPSSINSSWLHFEAGFAYARGVRVVPVAMLGAKLETLQPPLSLLQGFNLLNHKGLNNIIAIINNSFSTKYPESFKEEDYQHVFGGASSLSVMGFGEFSQYIESVKLQFALEKAACLSLFEKLIKQPGMISINQKRISTYGLQISEAGSSEKYIKVKIEATPELFFNHVNIILEFLSLALDEPQNKITLYFISNISTTSELWKMTSKLYDSLFTISDNQIIYKDIPIDVISNFHTRRNSLGMDTIKNYPILAIGLKALKNPPMISKIVSELFNREVLYYEEL